MSATFIDHHRRLVTWIASLFLVGLLLINSLVFFYQLNTANPQAPANPILSLPNGELLGADSQMNSSSASWLPMVASVGGMVAFAVILGLFNLLMIKRAEQRDNRRRHDLQKLAEAFEAYYQGYGHYPVSSSYEEGYYRAILVTNEWKHYDLPADEVMRTYVPGWPLSDPRIHPLAKEQTGNYLYYPQQQGQYFSLYAVLERGKDEPVTAQDGLGTDYDYYTYRMTSRRQPPVQAAPAQVEAEVAPAPIAPMETPATMATEPAFDWLTVDEPTEALVTETPRPATELADKPTMPAPEPLHQPESAPVIQASTLPLDVRLAQGTASAVRPLAVDQAAEPAPTSEPVAVSPSGVIQPRRQLAFSKTPPSDNQSTTSEVTDAKPARPLDEMPPLFFGEEDLQ